ncbi:MAG: hydroxyacid dehydrogenase [Nitrospirae bacterium]|nr:hydroxyacid dehydrogenase [Nitrospirota bacterium]
MNIIEGKIILISTSKFAQPDKMPLLRLQQEGLVVIENPYNRKLEKTEAIQLLNDNVVGLIAGLEQLDREVLEKSKLKVISRCGSGLSNVDLEAAKDLNIEVFNTPDAPTIAVAELTVGALISLARLILPMNSDMHAKKWNKRTGMQIKDKNIVIIGFGKIGQKVGEYLKNFNAKVVAVDPFLHGTINDIPLVDLEYALRIADIITMHCSGEMPLIGKKEFALMKDGVLLLNAARGGVIIEDDLLKALDSGKVAGVWLDTFKNEPYYGQLCNHEKVVLTPHIGSYTVETRLNMELEAVENLISALKRQYV